MTVKQRRGARPSRFSKKARRARARWRCFPRITRRVVAKLQQLQSDAVLISGDLFDGSKADLDALLEPWKGLSDPAGVYFVTGNHEEFTDRAQYLDAVERAGIRVLNNEKVEINGLQIIGVHDAELHAPDRKS